jgi:hypothetical protein
MSTPALRRALAILGVVAAPFLGTARADDADPWATARWLDKASRALRGGDGLAASEDVAALAALPRAEVVARFLADPRFGDSVLAFGLHDLGLYAGPLRDDEGRYAAEVLRTPQALLAARAAVTGGDALTLLALRAPALALPVTPEAGWRDAFNAHRAQVEALERDALAALQPASGAPDLARGCAPVRDARLRDASYRLLVYAAPTGYLELKRAADGWLGELRAACDRGDAAAAATALSAYAQRLRRIAAFGEGLRDPGYVVRGVADVRSWDQVDLGVDLAAEAFTPQFWATLPNSSTNHDRKRAAYVLRTYFCDDLTPITVPATPHGGAHGDEASCQACHYKLDPMAGFFRYRGQAGRDFQGLRSFSFDDGVTFGAARYAAYLDTWRAPVGSGRDWEVGFVRSTTTPSANAYGSSLADLARIIREAPEARTCLVRRLAQDVLGDGRIFDAGWIHELAQRFSARVEAAPGASAGALKELYASLVLSRAFAQDDPDPDACYDRAQDAPASTLPCRVAFALETNCQSCHNGEITRGGLDLTRLIDVGDGRLAFPHVDALGQQLPRAESLATIKDRLSTTDPDRRMPASREMPTADREALYLWISELIGQ